MGGRQGGSAMPWLTSGDDDDGGEVNGVVDEDGEVELFSGELEKKKDWRSQTPSNLIFRWNIINWN